MNSNYLYIRYGLFKRNMSFLNGTNSTYIEEMYKAWQKDTKSVHQVSHN